MKSPTTLILNLPPFWLKAGISKSSSGILVVAESVFTTSLFISWAERKTQPEGSTAHPTVRKQQTVPLHQTPTQRVPVSTPGAQTTPAEQSRARSQAAGMTALRITTAANLRPSDKEMTAPAPFPKRGEVGLDTKASPQGPELGLKPQAFRATLRNRPQLLSPPGP